MLQRQHFVFHLAHGCIEEAEATKTGLDLMSFEQGLHLEDLEGGTGAPKLMVDLGAGGTGAKVTAAAILLHIGTLQWFGPKRGAIIIAGILSICQEPSKNAERAKACRPTYSPILVSRSFSRNKRGIAGTLVWVNFNVHGLLDLVWKLGGQFVANVDDVRPQFSNSNGTYLSQNAIFQSTLVRGLPGLPPASANINALNGAPMTAVDGMKQLAKPWYSDQILPFDITLAGATEYGAATAMKIYGVEILNEGSGVSIDDAV
jgi:hypothetical protein